LKRKYVLLFAVAGGALAADQLSKWWAIATLKHQCDELERQGNTDAHISRCHDEELTVDLGGTAARGVRFVRAGTPFFELLCRGGAACLRGEVRLGEERADAQSLRLERDPVEQALLMLRGIPIEIGKLTSGSDGQMYQIQVTDAQSRISSLRFRYRSPGPGVKVIENVFHLRYIENPGAAWGLLSDVDEGFRGPFFTAISIAAVIFIGFIYRRIHDELRLLPVALSLVLGGALGNFIDRVRFGRVVDFIDWHYQDKLRWPTFNIADAAITVGVGLLLIDGIRGWRRERREKKQAEGTVP
jgi:signal peptidase II